MSPHYGFTAGPGMPEKLMETLTDALLSVAADRPLDRLSDLFGLKIAGEARVAARGSFPGRFTLWVLPVDGSRTVTCPLPRGPCPGGPLRPAAGWESALR